MGLLEGRGVHAGEAAQGVTTYKVSIIDLTLDVDLWRSLSLFSTTGMSSNILCTLRKQQRKRSALMARTVSHI